jgi:hypothetical protein
MAKKPIAKATKIEEKKETVNTIESSKSNSTLLYTILTAALLILMFVIRLNFLEIPYERDEGSYSYYGQLLNEGKTPYIDFYEQKPPGLFASYAIMEWFSGTSVKGLHAGFFIMNFFTSFFIFYWLRRLMNPIAGLVGAVLYSLLSLAPEASGYTIQAEHFITFYIAISFFLISKVYFQKNQEIISPKSRLLSLLVSGFFLGFALMTKPNALFFIPAIAFPILMAYLQEKNIKSFFKDVLTWGVGAAIPVLLLLGIVVLKGAWTECWYWMVTYPKNYVSAIPWDFGKQLLNGQLKVQWANYSLWYILGILGTIVIFAIKKWSWSQKCTILLVILGACLSVVPGLRFYAHYWIHFMPGVAIAVAALFAASSLFENKMVAMGAVGLFIILFIISINQRNEYYFNPNYTKVLHATYGDNPFPEMDVIAKYLKKKMTPSDEIGVLGSEPQLFMYLGKKSPTRHVFPGFFMSDVVRGPGFQQEMISDFDKTKPKYIVFVNHPYSWLVKEARQPIFDWYNNVVMKTYHPVGFADIKNNTPTNYVWDVAATTYKPTGEKNIIVWERNQ